MRSVKTTFLLLNVVGAILFSIGCTREFKNESIKISIPYDGALQSGLGNGTFNVFKLNFVVVNIHVPGQAVPIVKEIEYKKNPPLPGSSIEILIPNPPKSSGILVQYMGVFENDLGVMKFAYGDNCGEGKIYPNCSSLADTSSGTAEVNIIAKFSGSANKQGRIAGRYLTSVSDGPTGTVISTFQAPGNKPAMSVDKSYMYNGWFNVMVLDGTDATQNLLTHKILETGTVLFDKVNLLYFDTANDNIVSPGDHLLKISKPVTYRLEFDGFSSAVRPEAAHEFYVGYFGAPANFSTKKACISSYTQAVPNSYTDSGLSSPLVYNNGGSQATNLMKVSPASGSSGYLLTFKDIYGDAPLCDMSSGDQVVFHPHLLGVDGNDGFMGMKGPFLSKNTFAGQNGYLQTSYDDAADEIILDWKYLSGVATSSVTGAEVYAKFNASGGYSGGDDILPCDEFAAQNGYLFATDVASSETFNFSGGIGAITTAVNDGNKDNWRFLVCPYRQTGNSRKYLQDFIESSCMGGSCSDSIFHYGWGTGDRTVNPGGDLSSIIYSGSETTPRLVSAKITNVVLSGGLTQLTKSGVTYNAGSEVMLLVMGMKAPGDCGIHNGSPISVGQFALSRVVEDSTPTLYIPNGTFMDSVNLTNLAQATHTQANNFCYVQAVEIPHFHNLTLDSGRMLSADPFEYTLTGGGILALRVNGTLTLTDSGSILSATGKGYKATGINNNFSAGTYGDVYSTADSNHSGGESITGLGGDGGGSYGAGGNASTAGTRPGGGANAFNGNGSAMHIDRLFLGGGGGAGSAIAGNDGRGGGIIFVFAKNITSSSGTFEASGNAGTSGQAYGGGGAGTIIVVSENSNGGFNLNANGGAGTDDGADYAGGGGGGFIKSVVCNPQTFYSTSNLGGSSGGGAATPGAAGNVTTKFSKATNSDLYFCPN